MAIYHVHIASGSRADGQSAAVKVSYILREGAYGGRGDLVAWGSGHMPPWAAADPRLLFEAADLYERANGRLFVHVWVALPNEITAAERHELGLAIAAALTAAGLPFVYAIHAGDPKSPGEPANPHIHIVISERLNDGIPRDARGWFRRANRRDPARGGAAKDRRLKEITWVDDARRRIARLTNEQLALAGHEARVTADSHEVRILEAEAWGDTETAEVLRRCPPGVHLGPAAAAIERDRFRGKQGEAPELARAGAPTERGDVARAKAAEEERHGQELERVSAQLRLAREEEGRATASVAAARSAGLSDDEILAVYEESESARSSSGWAAVAAAAASRTERRNEAEAAATRLGIDAESVVRGARERGRNPVAALEDVVCIFKNARSALLSNEAVDAIRAAAETTEPGSGWAAVELATAERLERKKQADSAAAATGIIDIDGVYASARERREDPLSVLERVTEVVVSARAVLLTDEAIEAIRMAAESQERGSGWPAVAESARTRSARKALAESAAREAGIVDIAAVYAAARSRTEDPLTALESATGERRRRAGIVLEARAALLSDEAIEAIRMAAESAEPGSGWSAVELATAEQHERKKQAENAAAATGLIEIDVVYASARAGREDPLSMLERVTDVVVAARTVLLTDEAIEAIRVAAESRERGSGWSAVGESARTRSARKALAESAAREAGIADIGAVYAAARSRTEDPLTVLESATQALRHAARRERLYALPAGRELYIARLTAALDAGGAGQPTATQVEQALTATASDTERLARARAVFEDPWSRVHYTASAGGLGDRLTLAAVDAALTAAEDFAGRVAGLSEGAGLAELTAAVEDGGELTAAELDAALARAEEAERQAQEEARRRPVVEGREAAIRATKSGRDWLLEAGDGVLQGVDRQLTLDERETLATTVERRIREDFAARRETLAATTAGAELLEQTLAEGSADTLAAEEGLLELAAQRLEEHMAEQQKLFGQLGGEDLFTAHLAAIDPAWRPGGRTTAENRAAALRAAASDGERLERLRDVLEHPADADCYREVLATRGDRFLVEDVDAAVEAVAARRRERAAEERRATRRGALSVGGRELYAVRLAALAAANQPAGETPSGAAVDQALDETESDAGRLPRLDALFGDAELRSYYRGALGSAGDQHQVTLARLDEVLQATEAFRDRRNAIVQYPGGARHPSGAALWAAERKSPSPAVVAVAFDTALARVESQLEKRVQQAADEVELQLPATRPYPHSRPDYRVPALGDERLAELGQLRLEPADAFVEATVAALRERYARRARYDTLLRYSPQDRLRSEEQHLSQIIEMTWDRERRLWSPSSTLPQPTRSSALARVVKKYVLKVWEIVLVACDKILGGDLGERLRRRREQIEKVADVAERLLPTMPSKRGESPVPVAGDARLAGVVTDTTAGVVGEAVEVVWARYDRRSRREPPDEQRYRATDRDDAEQAYLAVSLKAAEARQQHEELRSGSSVPPTLDDARASVLEDHQSTLRQLFEVACDEVCGPGDLAKRWHRRREQVQRAVDVVEAGLQTTRLRRPDRDVPALSDETSIVLVAAETDPRRQAMWRELGERYHRRASRDTPYEQRYSAADRAEAEQSHLAVALEVARGRRRRASLRSGSTATRATLESTRQSVLEEHRSNLRELFEVACDEVFGPGELGERRRPRRDQVRRAVDVAEAALPTTQPLPFGRPDHDVPALSEETWDALVDDESDRFLMAMWRELGERYHRRASRDTPYDERYSADDRGKSERAHLDDAVMQRYRQLPRSSTPAAARASVLEEYRSTLRGIFMTARDEVLRADELRDRQQPQSDSPGGTSVAARAATAGGRPAQLPQRDEKPAPAAPEPPGPDIDRVADELLEEVLFRVGGLLAVSDHTANDEIRERLAVRDEEPAKLALEGFDRVLARQAGSPRERAEAETTYHEKDVDEALAEERRRRQVETDEENASRSWFQRQLSEAVMIEPDRDEIQRRVISRKIPVLVERMVAVGRRRFPEAGPVRPAPPDQRRTHEQHQHRRGDR